MTTPNRFFSLRDIGIFFYLVPFRMAASVLPTGAIRFFGLLMGHVYSALAYRRKRGIQQRLRTAFGNSATNDEIIALSRRCVFNAVTCHVDALIAHRIGTQVLLANGQVSGLEYLDNALLKGKGVLLVTGHFTGIKMVSRFLHASGYPHFGMVKKRADDPGASQVENRYLAPYWAKVIDRTRHAPVFVEDKDVGLRIMKRLRENGIVIISLDVPFSQHILTRPFLGSERVFPVGFLRIVHATGAAVVPMAGIGNSSAFHICFEEAVNLREAAGRDEFVEKNIDILVKILESQILKDPSHWLLI
jgi:Kdo2-lipid IVA lauroyltransferase/acyltransferase